MFKRNQSDFPKPHNAEKITEMDGIIAPAPPAFYIQHQTIDDLVDNSIDAY